MQAQKLIRDASGIAHEAASRVAQVERLSALLSAYFPGESIGVKAIEKWRERESIPSKWLMRILRVAESEGRPLDIGAYD